MASLIQTWPKMISLPNKINHAEWVQLEESRTRLLLDIRPSCLVSDRKWTFSRQNFVLFVLLDIKTENSTNETFIANFKDNSGHLKS